MSILRKLAAPNQEADDASPEVSGYAPTPAAGAMTPIPGYTLPLAQP